MTDNLNPQQQEPVQAIDETALIFTLSCLFYYHAAKLAQDACLSLDPSLLVIQNTDLPEVREALKEGEAMVTEFDREAAQDSQDLDEIE